MFQCFNKFQKSMKHDKNIVSVGEKTTCLKFQIKKTLALKLQQIIATLANSGGVSMFHKFLYIITISLKHPHKLLGSSPRMRAFMLIGRQDYTKLLATPALLLVQKVGVS